MQLFVYSCWYSGKLLKCRHGKRSLDVALSVRLANLPNLAKLELVKSESARQSAEVSVILHLDSGKRLQHTFPPSATLWQVIEHWRQTRWVHSGCRMLHI